MGLAHQLPGDPRHDRVEATAGGGEALLEILRLPGSHRIGLAAGSLERGGADERGLLGLVGTDAVRVCASLDLRVAEQGACALACFGDRMTRGFLGTQYGLELVHPHPLGDVSVGDGYPRSTALV